MLKVSAFKSSPKAVKYLRETTEGALLVAPSAEGLERIVGSEFVHDDAARARA